MVINKNLLSMLSKSGTRRKYAGKHVMVARDEVLPLKEGAAGLRDFQRLKKRDGQSPTLAFVPRSDISYILIT